jgi:hypothetical protein
MAVRWSGLLVRSASQEATKDHPKGRQRTPVSMGCRCCCQFVKCANLTNLQGCEFVKWLGGMDLGAVRSSWDEYRDQRHRSKRTNSMRTRGELGKANADVSKSRKL